jgi:hypothetical protein
MLPTGCAASRPYQRTLTVSLVLASFNPLWFLLNLRVARFDMSPSEPNRLETRLIAGRPDPRTPPDARGRPNQHIRNVPNSAPPRVRPSGAFFWAASVGGLIVACITRPPGLFFLAALCDG